MRCGDPELNFRSRLSGRVCLLPAPLPSLPPPHSLPLSLNCAAVTSLPPSVRRRQRQHSHLHYYLPPAARPRPRSYHGPLSLPMHPTRCSSDSLMFGYPFLAKEVLTFGEILRLLDVKIGSKFIGHPVSPSLFLPTFAISVRQCSFQPCLPALLPFARKVADKARGQRMRKWRQFVGRKEKKKKMVRGGGLGGNVHITSSKSSDILTPSLLVCISTQPPLLSFLSEYVCFWGFPLPPPRADIICTCS